MMHLATLAPEGRAPALRMFLAALFCQRERAAEHVSG